MAELVKPTIGQIREVAAKEKTKETVPVRELSNAMFGGDFDQKMRDAIKDGLKRFSSLQDHFFIEGVTLKNKLYNKLIRLTLMARRSPPSYSNYSQTLYKYTIKDETLELLWTIPDMDTSEFLKVNALLLKKPEERMLLNYIIAHEDGTLDAVANSLALTEYKTEA